MTLREVAVTAALCVALALSPSLAAPGQPDLWTVAHVAVDATGASPSAAREAALNQGRRKAFTEVFRRLTPAGEWTRQPQLSDLELEPMVKSFDISGEKHSSTRYLASVTYVFNPTSVRNALRRSGNQFSETTARPVLVVPLSGAAWAPDSPWGRAWHTQSQRGRLVPVFVPLGDAADTSTLAATSTAADWSVVGPLAGRYGAGTVMVAAASRTASGLSVSMTQIRPDGSRSQKSASFAPQGTEDEAALALRAAGAIADGLQEDWKRTTSVDYGQQASITVMVPFATIQDWISIRRHLQGTRLIQLLAVEELNMSNARVRLDYVGKVDQLQAALSQTNLYLTPDAQGNWTLTRNAAAAAAGSGQVVP